VFNHQTPILYNGYKNVCV